MRIIRNMQEDPPAPPPAHGCDDVRCGCGNLLARVVGGEVELKCRRCKQVWRLALGAGSPRWRLLDGGTR
jgi:hypothetical protein